MRRPGPQKRAKLTREKSATAAKRQRTVRLVPALTSLPLVDIGVGANVLIRFPVTGPVVEIINVNRVPIDWVRCLLATMMATRSAK
jgi:hypothetical protein